MPRTAPVQIRSRNCLIQRLSDARVPVDENNLPCLGERLGRLFGLGDTMALDAATAYRSRQPGTHNAGTLEQLCQELVRARRALIDQIADYGEAAPEDDDGTRDPEQLLNHYRVQQRKLAATSRQLRDKVRRAMKAQSQSLARLAELDSVFDHTMASYTSQCFAHIPNALEQQLQGLQTSSQTLSEHSQERSSDSDIWPYCHYEEARNLLLAELEVRLEPVLGLLEAFHQEVNQSS